MVFVPDAAPHFVLVCLENLGWSVRDYSSGHARLLPTIALGRPIDQIVSESRTHGCLAFGAPRVPVSDQNFWKRLTDELGKRFLGASTSIADLPGHSYPILSEAAFKDATEHLIAGERERILRSPRSVDWTTWNAMQVLVAAHPYRWWTEIAREAARSNPSNQLTDSVPDIGFWNFMPPSDSYDQWKRHQFHAAKNRRARERGADPKPLEEPTRVDLCFDSGSWLVFGESKIRQDMGLGTPCDARRNRIIQLADCLVTEAKGRPCALWFFVRGRAADTECVQLVERYRSSPEMFAAELPYHSAEALYGLAQRLTIVRWANLVGPLLARRSDDDPLTARVRKELRRRIQPGDAPKAIGAKA